MTTKAPAPKPATLAEMTKMEHFPIQTTAKQLRLVYGDCPATNNGQHIARNGQCTKCGCR